MPKFIQANRNVVTAAGGTVTVNPALSEVINGVDTLSAPHIVFAVPKAAGAAFAVTTPLAAGNIDLVRTAGGGAINADVLYWRLHPVLRGAGVAEQYAQSSPALAVAGTGGGGPTNYNPLLTANNVAQIPDLIIPQQKVVPAAATSPSLVSSVLAAGVMVLDNGEAAPVATDVLAFRSQTIQRVLLAGFGNGQDKRRYFTIGNGVNAPAGSTYFDTDDATRIFQVTVAKVAGDGSLLLTTLQVAGTTVPTIGGADTLTRVSGAGDAAITYTGIRWEKYIHIAQNVNISNAGTTFTVNDVGLVEGGVPAMPDIVIPIPKVAVVQPFVPTDLAAGMANIVVQHQNVMGNAAHDVVFLKVHSAFR